MYSNNTLYKRLIRELNDLKKYDNISKLELVFPFENDPLPFNIRTMYCKDTPYIRLKIDENDLAFAFNESFPFRPPILLINNIDSIEYFNVTNLFYNNLNNLKNQNENLYKNKEKDIPFQYEMINELKQKYNFKCLCCETLLCPGKGKWSPAIHLDVLLDEYKKFKNIKTYLNSYGALLELNKCLGNILPLEMIEHIKRYL